MMPGRVAAQIPTHKLGDKICSPSRRVSSFRSREQKHRDNRSMIILLDSRSRPALCYVNAPRLDMSAVIFRTSVRYDSDYLWGRKMSPKERT